MHALTPNPSLKLTRVGSLARTLARLRRATGYQAESLHDLIAEKILKFFDSAIVMMASIIGSMEGQSPRLNLSQTCKMTYSISRESGFCRFGQGGERKKGLGAEEVPGETHADPIARNGSGGGGAKLFGVAEHAAGHEVEVHAG